MFPNRNWTPSGSFGNVRSVLSSKPTKSVPLSFGESTVREKKHSANSMTRGTIWRYHVILSTVTRGIFRPLYVRWSRLVPYHTLPPPSLSTPRTSNIYFVPKVHKPDYPPPPPPKFPFLEAKNLPAVHKQEYLKVLADDVAHSPTSTIVQPSGRPKYHITQYFSRTSVNLIYCILC